MIYGCWVFKAQRPSPLLSRKTANGRFFFSPHPPSQNGHSKVGKFSNVLKAQFLENIGRALCQYVTAAGFSPRPSQLFFNNRRADRNIKNEINMEYVLWNC